MRHAQEEKSFLFLICRISRYAFRVSIHTVAHVFSDRFLYLKLAGATHFGLIERVGELDARLAAFVDRVWGGAEPPVP